jgi:hypothetical protein
MKRGCSLRASRDAVRDKNKKDALFIEGPDSPYANLVAARPDNVNSPARPGAGSGAALTGGQEVCG